MGRALGKVGAVAAPAMRGATTFSRDWREPENIRSALNSICEGKDSFPSKDDFQAAGLAGLYMTLKGNGELKTWIQEMGFARSAAHSSTPRSPSINWTDEKIEEILTSLAKDGFFPPVITIREAGYNSLYVFLRKNQLLDYWAERLGLTRLGPGDNGQEAWPDEKIEEVLRSLSDGVMFPSVNEMKKGGYNSLYVYLNKNQTLDYWANRLGLTRRTVSAKKEDRVVPQAPHSNDLANRLQALIGVDLRRLQRRQSGVGEEALRPKSWAQYVVRNTLGKAARDLPIRTVPAKVDSQGNPIFSSTMPLTPIELQALGRTPFEESDVAESLKNFILIMREAEGKVRPSSCVLAAKEFKLEDNPDILARIKADYQAIQDNLVATGELDSSLGDLIQTRTKGLGGDSPVTFAFYARPQLLQEMIHEGSVPAEEVNKAAQAPRLFRYRKPTEETLKNRFEKFLSTRNNDSPFFPKFEEFKEKGQEELYWQLRATKELADWGQEVGLSRTAREVWSGPRIESELKDFLAGRSAWPSKKEFDAQGEDGRRLYKRVMMYGGIDFWARWMEVVPRHPTDKEVDQVMTRFLAGRTVWPGAQEFKLAGISSIHQQLSSQKKTVEMQKKFSLSPIFWTEERITTTLKEMSERLGRFPTTKEMERDGRGLRSVVTDTGGASAWAKKLGFSQVKMGRPAKTGR